MSEETIVIDTYDDPDQEYFDAIEGEGLDSQAFVEFLNDRGGFLEDWEDYQKDFEDSYVGQYGSRQEFAEELGEQIDLLGDMAESLRYYFDWEKWGRDLFMGGDYWESNGYYFRRI